MEKVEYEVETDEQTPRSNGTSALAPQVDQALIAAVRAQIEAERGPQFNWMSPDGAEEIARKAGEAVHTVTSTFGRMLGGFISGLSS
jgi:hypothetical protein